MALIHLDHVPVTVKVNLPLNIILPDPGRMNGVPVRERKVLYLLHGLSDDASAWQRYSSIETYANAYGLVVVMPSVGRSFYVDQPNGQAYFAYITEELPRYLADVFGLLPRREDTLIAGISMGGYGAFKAAFLHPELYHAAASLSGVLSMRILTDIPDDKRHAEFALLFGDLSKLAGSAHDPELWLKNAAQNSAALPKLYMACGRQEDLYPLNVYYHKLCQSLGVDINYHEADGKHDWLFWDIQIRRFLAEVLGPIPA
ncbi:MAG: esterase [Chloroflexi bacterium HGW-Chloroflexi-10]|nr:MAG: esterase [Chloroflexi bacterium HGW-Chloroflexi-10]